LSVQKHGAEGVCLSGVDASGAVQIRVFLQDMMRTQKRKGNKQTNKKIYSITIHTVKEQYNTNKQNKKYIHIQRKHTLQTV
jgi:disulfide oxidoreductase YuzD